MFHEVPQRATGSPARIDSPAIEVAIFDLDNTLLAGDSDHGWGEFLAQSGVVDPVCQLEQNERYLRDYQAGCLDMDAFMAFALEPLANNDMSVLLEWRSRFLREVVEPMMLATGRALVDAHARLGRTLLIATATNSFVTRPIAEAFGVTELVATEPEMRNGRFTGRLSKPPCLGEGKRDQVLSWLAARGWKPAQCCFYSDSRNDIPLLLEVARPFAVDPDAHLREFAHARNWPVVTLRVTT